MSQQASKPTTSPTTAQDEVEGTALYAEMMSRADAWTDAVIACGSCAECAATCATHNA